MKCIVFLYILISTSIFCQDTFEFTVVVDEEIEAFTGKVTKALIEQDCNEYYRLLGDSVVLFLNATPIRDTLVCKSNIKNYINELCANSITSDSLNHNYYLENFDQIHFDSIALTQLEIYQNISFNDLLYLNLKNDDHLFLGSINKVSEGLELTNEDLFRFLFRKINGNYKIVMIMHRLK